SIWTPAPRIKTPISVFHDILNAVAGVGRIAENHHLKRTEKIENVFLDGLRLDGFEVISIHREEVSEWKALLFCTIGIDHMVTEKGDDVTQLKGAGSEHLKKVAIAAAGRLRQEVGLV
ncbi:hypothetical protein PanWU01x14_102160, partial [Parasponia andersonii]